MSVTIRDAADAEALGSTVGPEVEVYGPTGQLLGRFTPAPRPGMTYPEFGLTDEELERRANDPDGWVTAAQVEARLIELKDAP